MASDDEEGSSPSQEEDLSSVDPVGRVFHSGVMADQYLEATRQITRREGEKTRKVIEESNALILDALKDIRDALRDLGTALRPPPPKAEENEPSGATPSNNTPPESTSPTRAPDTAASLRVFAPRQARPSLPPQDARIAPPPRGQLPRNP